MLLCITAAGASRPSAAYLSPASRADPFKYNMGMIHRIARCLGYLIHPFLRNGKQHLIHRAAYFAHNMLMFIRTRIVSA